MPDTADQPHAAQDASTPPPVGDWTQEGPKVAQISTGTAGIHGCGRCSNRWGGLNTAHCPRCHQTFTGLTAFDKHRDGNHAHGTRHCVDPAKVGLVDAGRGYPCWGQPGGETDFRRNPGDGAA